jgi:hypothetical protein
MKPYLLLASLTFGANVDLLRAETTVNVLVIEKPRSEHEEGKPAVGARVQIIPEEGTSGLIGYTDAAGRTSIRFRGSRSFVLDITSGPGETMTTSRMYGKVNHETSVYMGPGPAYQNEDALGDVGKTILSVAEDASKGLPQPLKQRYADKHLDDEIDRLKKEGKLSNDEAAKYRQALQTIRGAPELKRQSQRRQVPLQRNAPCCSVDSGHHHQRLAARRAFRR